MSDIDLFARQENEALKKEKHELQHKIIDLRQNKEELQQKIDQIKDIYTSMQFSAPENYYLWIDKLGEILGGKE